MAETEGNSTQIDNEIITFFSELDSLAGPIHLGPLFIETWDEFDTFATTTMDDGRREVKFANLFAVGMNDSRDTGPNKITERTHQYMLILIQQYIDGQTYIDMRAIVEDVLDKLAQNYRPQGPTALVSVSPGSADLDLDKLDNNHVVFRSTITFTALEQIRYT